MRVIHISDTHLAPGQAALDRNFEAAADHIRAARPKLVVHTGDITRDAPGAPGELEYAAGCLSAIDAEVLMLPGNHDVGDNPGDGGYQPKTPVTRDRLEAFRRVIGPDRWVADRGDWRFVGLNSLLFLSGLLNEADQWAWLDEALGDHPRIALFLHKPVWLSEHETPADPPYRYVPEAPRARLAELIESRGVRLVGCGHVHQSRQHRVGKTLFVWAPGTSFILPDTMQPPIGEKVCGVVAYELGADGGVSATVIRPSGIVDHDVTNLGLYGAPALGAAARGNAA